MHDVNKIQPIVYLDGGQLNVIFVVWQALGMLDLVSVILIIYFVHWYLISTLLGIPSTKALQISTGKCRHKTEHIALFRRYQTK